MTASPHAARSLDVVLGQALDDLEGGLTPPQVLDRYPEYEAELGSLVETAHRLRTTRWPVLSLAARVSGRERMHAALAEHQSRRRSLLPPIWRQLGAGLALAVLAGTTYFASPISPLQSMRRSGPTATLPIVATATWTVPASPTWQPPAIVLPTATPVPSATFKVREVIEPTEAFDLELPVDDTPTPRATTQPSAAPTRATMTPAKPTMSPSHTPTSTSTPESTAFPTDTAAGPSDPGAPPVAPSATPEAATVSATMIPTATATTPSPATATVAIAPSATATTTLGKPTPSRLPAPTQTSAPTYTVAPSVTPKSTHTAPPQQPALTPTPEAPIPTETIEAPLPTRTRRHAATPEATQAPEPTQSSKATETPPALDVSRLREGPPGDSAKPGQELRAALQEWRRTHLPGARSRRP